MSIRNIIVIALLFFIKICPTVISTTDQPYLNLHDDKIAESNIDNFSYSWSNKTRGKRDNSETDLVDCPGKTVLGLLFKQKPEQSKVEFYMSSRKSKRSLVILKPQLSLNNVDFEPGRRTIVIVHGFRHNSEKQWIKDMEAAFLQWDDVNMIIVDWRAEKSFLKYAKAAMRTQTVGVRIAQFLESIVNVTKSERGNDKIIWGPLHLVGHSLGAHICGFAGKELKKKKLPWTVTRITGLDPAQPCFGDAHESLRLCKGDAKFVDVIHTNGKKVLLNIALGLRNSIGDVDFYPNGGLIQPGCIDEAEEVPVSPRSKITLCTKKAVKRASCSHGRAYRYMTESILSAVTEGCHFWAYPWDFTRKSVERVAPDSCSTNDCMEMGINSFNHSQRGNFFVFTSSHAPFCTHETKLNPEVVKYLPSSIEKVPTKNAYHRVSNKFKKKPSHSAHETKLNPEVDEHLPSSIEKVPTTNVLRRGWNKFQRKRSRSKSSKSSKSFQSTS